MPVARHCVRTAAKKCYCLTCLCLLHKACCWYKRDFWVRKRDFSVPNWAGLEFYGTLLFSLDSCVVSHVELFTVSYGWFKSLVNAMSGLKAWSELITWGFWRRMTWNWALWQLLVTVLGAGYKGMGGLQLSWVTPVLPCLWILLLPPLQVKRNSTPPLSLYGQLLWREFFYTAATNNPKFDRMEGNPICIQIPWDKNPEALAKWAEGKTGFPWIDAIMTQLRQEGWIHHLARHAVACFLTRGDLWISWESGVRVSLTFPEACRRP